MAVVVLVAMVVPASGFADTNSIDQASGRGGLEGAKECAVWGHSHTP